MDFGALFKIKQAWNTFLITHPKVSTFISEIQGKPFNPGTQIAIAIRFNDGSEHRTAITVKDSDIELINILESLRK